METKLTLRLKKDVIERAKEYAKENNTSVSRLVEVYLDALTHNTPTFSGVSRIVSSLSGVIHLEQGYNEKEAFSKYISTITHEDTVR